MNQAKTTRRKKQPPPTLELQASPLIVILGAFNDKIFRDPRWCSNYLFEKSTPEEVAVNINLNIIDDKINTTVLWKDIELSLIGNRLQIKVPRIDDIGFSIVMDIVTRLAACVPHTPITALGVNFLFETKLEKTDGAIVIGISKAEPWTFAGTRLIRPTECGLMRCESELEKNTGVLKVSFNFHNEIKENNLMEVKNKIMNGLIEKALAISRPIAETIRCTYEGAQE